MSWRRMRERSRWGEGWDGMSRHRSRERSRSVSRLNLDVGLTTLRFGENLTAKEREWLRDALNQEIRRAREAQKRIG
jgi:hypothetical protein